MSSQLVKHFEEKPQNNQLVARLTLPTNAVTVQGEKLSGLPPTLSAVMQSPRTTGYRGVRDEVKANPDRAVFRVRQPDPEHHGSAQRPVRPVASVRRAERDHHDYQQRRPPASSAPRPLSADDSDNLAYHKHGSDRRQPAKPQACRHNDRDHKHCSSTTTSTTADCIRRSSDTTCLGSAAVKPVGRLPSIWRQRTPSRVLRRER